MEGRHQEDHGSSPAWAKVFKILISTNRPDMKTRMPVIPATLEAYAGGMQPEDSTGQKGGDLI
jgi:hypothetical protein